LASAKAFQQEALELQGLLERRVLHSGAVLVPEAVGLADRAALHFEDEEPAGGLRDDEIALTEVGIVRADTEGVPGVPARGEGGAESVVDAALGMRAPVGRGPVAGCRPGVAMLWAVPEAARQGQVG
jgi:hypothetical protein